jgi:hypothetical protein
MRLTDLLQNPQGNFSRKCRKRWCRWATSTKFLSRFLVVAIESFRPCLHGFVGRPELDRLARAQAFITKMIVNLPTLRVLIDWLRADQVLRRLGGWERIWDIPDESSPSRAFAGFAEIALLARLHGLPVKSQSRYCIIGRITRDSTAIEGPKKPDSTAEPAQPEPSPLKKAAEKPG